MTINSELFLEIARRLEQKEIVGNMSIWWYINVESAALISTIHDSVFGAQYHSTFGKVFHAPNAQACICSIGMSIANPRKQVVGDDYAGGIHFKPYVTPTYLKDTFGLSHHDFFTVCGLNNWGQTWQSLYYRNSQTALSHICRILALENDVRILKGDDVEVNRQITHIHQKFDNLLAY